VRPRFDRPRAVGPLVDRARLGSAGLLLAVLASACAGSRPEREQKPTVATLYELDLRDHLPEQAHALLGDEQPGFSEALLKVRGLLDEPLAKGLFVRLGELDGRFGDLRDWADTFEAFRAQKRPVHCHFDSTDNLGIALAAHCDRVSVTPAGMVNLVGIAAQLVHGRELLSMLGVKADLLQVGKYKGAAEPFTRDAPTPELLESINTLLDGLDQDLRAHLGQNGKRSPAEVTALIDGGPYSADEAKAKKLVDAVSFDDEARAIAKKAVSAAAQRAIFPKREPEALSLGVILRALGEKEERIAQDVSRLAVVQLSGEIVDGDARGGERTGSDAFVKAMRRFADDTRVRAVVLRIESPGGSALASDRMWHAVRRAAARKPVIVSVGDMAASGGYYVASAGSHILASEGSVLGSIGVVGGKMVAADLADKVGLNVTVLSRGKHATWLSPLTPFSDEERTSLEQALTRVYRLFLERIATGRKRGIEQFAPASEGRVMGGLRAKELGLIDEIGGVGRAVTLARERGKLTKNAPIVRWPEAETPFSAFEDLFGANASKAQRAREVLTNPLVAEAVIQSALLGALAHPAPYVMATLPFVLRID
jgi:protease-4